MFPSLLPIPLSISTSRSIIRYSIRIEPPQHTNLARTNELKMGKMRAVADKLKTLSVAGTGIRALLPALSGSPQSAASFLAYCRPRLTLDPAGVVVSSSGFALKKRASEENTGTAASWPRKGRMACGDDYVGY